MNPLILYHSECWDGFGAAWAAWRKFGAAAEYRAAKYGEPFPSEAHGREVYILDFSWPYSDLQAAFRQGIHPTQIEVHDHHKTARDDAQRYDPISALIANEPALVYHFDLEHSGAVLAWTRFHPALALPTLLRYVEDRDLWRFTLSESQEVSAWLHSWPLAFDVWNDLARLVAKDPSAVAKEGHAILRFQHQQVQAMCEHARWQAIAGYQVPVANATVLYSEVGEALCQRYPDAPFAAYYMDRADGKRQWGLRSRGEFDVSEVAKQYGGGGHKNAAGFVEDL